MNNIAGRLEIANQLLNAGLITKTDARWLLNMICLDEFDMTAKECFDTVYSDKFKDIINE